jgi:hypothetical protein
MDRELKDIDPTFYTDDFEPPQDWVAVRDEEGVVVPGCWRTEPAKDSDEI